MHSIRQFLLRDILALMALVTLGLGGFSWYAGWVILRHQAAYRLDEGMKALARDVEEHEAVGVRCASHLRNALTPWVQDRPGPLPDRAISEQLTSFPEIHSIRLLTPSGAFLWPASDRQAVLQRPLLMEEHVLLGTFQTIKGPSWDFGQTGRRDPDIWASHLTPLRAGERLKGILAVDMSVASLRETLHLSEPHPAMSIHLLAADGFPLLQITQGMAMGSAHEAIRQLAGTPQAEPQVLDADGISHLAKAKTFPGKEWKFAVTMPLREFDRDYRRFRMFLLGFGAGFFLLLAWRTLLLARRVRAPLRQLAEVTRAMEAGQVPPPVQSDIREVRRLSDAVIRAAEAMQRQLQFERNATSGQRLELMGSLAGGIAHDVNNHLTAIMGQMGMAREGLPREHASYLRLERAEEAALRCSDMIRALLNFSGRTPPDMEALDLNLVVTRSGELFERLLGGLIRLELQLHPSLPRIQGSRVNMEQVLMNLAVNARDAMPEGGTLTIATRPGHAKEVQLVVSDTGRGIPEAHLSHIFEPFFTTKSPDKGSGLGLAMVQSIVREQGGEIAVTSQEGQGTTFTLGFPATEEPSLMLPRPTTPLVLPASLEGRRILVVEDETNLRELLSETFLKSRALVASAPNGAIAWHILQESAFDLVFTDQRMPEMSGLQLIERIRRLSPDLPVILASGFHLEGPELELIGRDPHLRFLAKPFLLPAVLNLAGSMLRTADLSVRTPPPESPA